jgi:DNA-binding NtrC family response regulator
MSGVAVADRRAAAPFTVLIVEDEELYARAIARELGRRGVPCDLAFSAAEGLARAEQGRYQLVLLDHRLPDDDGIRVIPLLLARQPGASVVMMTAYHAIPNAVQAIRQGAEDYVVKETSVEPIVARVLEARARHTVKATSAGWKEHKRGGLLGRSPAMLRAIEQLGRIARSPETTVLLTGETGVGKEVAARYLHEISAPPGAPLVIVDCMTVPANLAESLLFGHEKGAFTGADTARAGAFAEARDGTIFLDEIGDLGDLQGKLLRVMESRTFQRLGRLESVPMRARVVGATNRDLAPMVAAGTFRRDLYERLSVFPIHLPPLRERAEDVELLAEHFRAFYAERLGKELRPLDEEVMARLRAYPYPGNVRELKNVIERAVIMTESDKVELRHLPERVLAGRSGAVAGGLGGAGGIPIDFVPGVDSLEALEVRMITQALRRSGNVKAEAARLLGISRFQLLRRLEKYQIQ